MCRLMGFVSFSEISLVEAAGAEFTEFAALSARHGDGWGIVTCNTDQHPSLLVEPTRAKESAAFEEASRSLKSNGALLHLRWATGALSVNEGNTHPFTHGDYSFIHNGALNPAEAVDHLIDPQLLALRRGQTDSESYFYLIINEIEKFGVVDGIRSAIKLIRTHVDYSSINAMLLTPSHLYVINEHDQERAPQSEGPGYYDLFFRNDGKEVLVASSGWTQTGWEELPNHTLMVVDRTALVITMHSLSE